MPKVRTLVAVLPLLPLSNLELSVVIRGLTW